MLPAYLQKECLVGFQEDAVAGRCHGFFPYEDPGLGRKGGGKSEGLLLTAEIGVGADEGAVVERLFENEEACVEMTGASAETQGVLIDGYEGRVGDERKVFHVEGIVEVAEQAVAVVEGCDIKAEGERTAPHTPENELGSVLIHGHSGSVCACVGAATLAVKTAHHHVGIVETVDAAIGPYAGENLDVVHHTAFVIGVAPAVAGVVGGTPATASCLGAPQPGLESSPLTDIEQEGIGTMVVESLAHIKIDLYGPTGVGRPVPALGLEVGIAEIIFQEVESPKGKVGCICILVMKTAGLGMAAGEGSTVAVDSGMETSRVDVVGERLQSGGELFGYGNKVSLPVALGKRPTVVDTEIGISGVAEAQLLHSISEKMEFLLGNIVLEDVPCEQSHEGGGLGECAADEQRDGILVVAGADQE